MSDHSHARLHECRPLDQIDRLDVRHTITVGHPAAQARCFSCDQPVLCGPSAQHEQWFQ
jgi:hypothetical protein